MNINDSCSKEYMKDLNMYIESLNLPPKNKDQLMLKIGQVVSAIFLNGVRTGYISIQQHALNNYIGIPHDIVDNSVKDINRNTEDVARNTKDVQVKIMKKEPAANEIQNSKPAANEKKESAVNEPKESAANEPKVKLVKSKPDTNTIKTDNEEPTYTIDEEIQDLTSTMTSTKTIVEPPMRPSEELEKNNNNYHGGHNYGGFNEPRRNYGYRDNSYNFDNARGREQRGRGRGRGWGQGRDRGQGKQQYRFQKRWKPKSDEGSIVAHKSFQYN